MAHRKALLLLSLAPALTACGAVKRAAVSARPAAPGCSVTVASATAAQQDVATQPGGVVCLAAGTYAGLALGRTAASDVTLRAAPGARVTITAGPALQGVAVRFAPGARDITLHGVHVAGEITLMPGDASITIDHDDISGGPYGIQLNSSNCTAANAPTWTGCRPAPPIVDTVISGNRIHGIVGRADALNVDNYAGLRITGNDIYDIIEGGDHSDCLQSTFGGRDLVFDHNYEHDNECQGFFVKDGDVHGVTFDENLFVRDELPAVHGASADSSSQVYNVDGLVARHNTIWDGKGLTLRCVNSSVPCDASVQGNVLQSLNDGSSGDPRRFRMAESGNLLGRGPWSFAPAAGDQVTAAPFAAAVSTLGRVPGRIALRVAGGGPAGAGVDWSPATRHYGP